MNDRSESGISKKMELVSNISSGPRRARKYPPASSAVRGWMRLWPEREPIPFQSSIERDLLIMCGALKSVIDVSWEPLTISFRDNIAARDRSYTPDFLISLENHDGTRSALLVETKRHEDLKRKVSDLEPCFAAAHLWAISESNTRFALIDDFWMQSVGLENLRMINAFRQTKYATETRDRIVNELEMKSRLTLESVLTLLSAETINMNSAMAMLMAMVWDHEVCFTLNSPLEMESTITRGRIRNPFEEFFFP